MTQREQTYGTGPPGPDPATAREEAERLVAAGLAALSMAADRIGAPTRERGGAAAAGYDVLGDMLFGPANRGHRVANESPECCQCPVCKLISAARSPSPGFAERLASGVGTVAEGAARVLRTVAGPGGAADPADPRGAGDPVDPPGAADPADPGGVDWVREREHADPWAAVSAVSPEPVSSEPVSSEPVSSELAGAPKVGGSEPPAE